MRIHLRPYLVLSVILLAAPYWAQEPPKLSVRSLMTESEFRITGLNKLTPEELAQLNNWLARFATAVVDASRRPTTPPVVTRLSLADLEGAIIVANDGHPLGLITSNCFNSDALCNEFGKYGNEFNSDSILNEFGTYGNEFSSKSPFNEFTTMPPKIFKDGQAIAYLTANTSLSPRVDPLWLLGVLKVKR